MSRWFDGFHDYLYTSPAKTAAPVSMAVWFYPETIAANQMLIGLIETGGANSSFRLNAEGAVGGDPLRAYTIGPGVNKYAQASTGFSINTWQHACGVFAANNDRRVYLNGGNKGTNSESATPTGISNTILGARPYTPLVFDSLLGSLAEAAIWDVALTDDDVLILSKGYSPLLVKPESLLLYVPLIRSNDEDLIGGLSLTSFGIGSADITAHPRVFYPSPQGLHIDEAAPVFNPPTNLVCTVVSSTQIDLSWTDNSPDETGFSVERSTDGVSFSVIDTVPANVTAYNDTGLTPGTTY